MKTSQEVREASGLTQGQFHRLIHGGFIGTLDHAPGSGFHRRFTDQEAEHAIMTGHLWRAGLSKDAAAGVAAQIQANGEAILGGFRLRLADATVHRCSLPEPLTCMTSNVIEVCDWCRHQMLAARYFHPDISTPPGVTR